MQNIFPKPVTPFFIWLQTWTLLSFALTLSSTPFIPRSVPRVSSLVPIPFHPSILAATTIQRGKEENGYLRLSCLCSVVLK